MSEAFFPFDDEDEDPLSGMIFPSDELPWWRRPFSAMLGRCRRFRFKADELLEQLREAAHEELSLLAL